MLAESVSRNVFPGLILGIVVAPASQGAAVEQLFYGPWQIPRTGAVTQVQASIEVPATLTAPYRLHVQNGDGAGSHRILSATVALNGTAVVFPWDFYDINLQPPGVGVQTVLSLDRTVSLQTRNTLRVRFLGVP